MLTLPSPTPPPPSPTSPDPGDGVNRSKFNFFPEQHQHKPTKTFVRGQHARIQDFFVRGRMGGGVWGGGGGVQAPQLYLQFTEGSNGFSTHFPGEVQLFPVGGVQMLISIETHVTCDFQGGSRPHIGFWTPYPALWIRTWTMWQFGTNRLRRACVASS